MWRARVRRNAWPELGGQDALIRPRLGRQPVALARRMARDPALAHGILVLDSALGRRLGKARLGALENPWGGLGWGGVRVTYLGGMGAGCARRGACMVGGSRDRCMVTHAREGVERCGEL